MIDLDVDYRVGEFRLQITFSAPAGLIALVGPSGSGKTTLLNIIAGLRRPGRGRVAVAGTALFDSATGLSVPAYGRQIGYVFQEPRLFPHLTVQQNLRYGRWVRGGGSQTTAESHVIETLKLQPLLGRTPSALSGGEKQRVALGRALLSSPRLLLLDEPLASVDRAHREEILPYVDRIRVEQQLPVIYVTHTWAEVSNRADYVIALRDGRVERSGPRDDI